MHFPIIEICSDKEQFGQSLYDDPVLQYRTDYYGKEYSEEEREDFLNSPGFKDYFAGLAELDPAEGVLRVYDADTIRKTLVDYHEYLLDRLAETDYSQRGLYAMFFDLRPEEPFEELRAAVEKEQEIENVQRSILFRR